ncbi:sigma factor-like helix-turn-helix DNA-binding protein [Streptomyces sp. NPDC050548]|uniref:sigma factor-like helix-turn-helix DNA-binding protein n=1 Tax=Streptomyces sp. NPDC050548 TaxID=3365629 RepID=UPI0037B32E0B
MHQYHRGLGAARLVWAEANGIRDRPAEAVTAAVMRRVRSRVLLLQQEGKIRPERLYSTEGSVRGWLLTVTRNLVVDRMRSAVARHETVGAEDKDMPLPDHTGAVLASVVATGLLRRLSHEHREVLLHTYLCGRTVQETARVLGIPAGTVKSRRHYALNILRSEAGENIRREVA